MNETVREAPAQPKDVGVFSWPLDFSSLQSLAVYLGIAGVSGGGFAALSFGIGYLAIKSHDEMIGLPIGIASNTAYVRTGALFFTNSFYYVLVATFYIFVIACLAALIVQFVMGSYSSKLLGRWYLLLRNVWQRSATPLFFLSQFVLLLTATLLIHHQVAAFDPMNKNLLYQFNAQRKLTASNDASKEIKDGNAWLTGTGVRKRLTRIVEVVSQRRSALATRINEDLQKSDGPSRLRHRYGRQLAVFLLLCLSLALARPWRRRLHTNPDTPIEQSRSAHFFVVDWFVRPSLYLLVGGFLFNLPANYGVLCIETSAPYIRVHMQEASSDEEPPSGFLLSDLSSDNKELWLLGKDPNDNFMLAVFQREKLSWIELTEHWTPNMLALESF